MAYELYEMPDIDFVGGSSRTLPFYIYKLNEVSGVYEPYNLENCEVNFSIIDYINKNSEFAIRTGIPLISKQGTIGIGDNGIENFVTVDLYPKDTHRLHGLYIYQLIINDLSGNADVPNQGEMNIVKNTNANYIEQLN